MKKDTEPHPVKLSLLQGGLFRCCIETWMAADVTENEGDILPCKYCKSRLIVKDRIWQWDSDYKPKDEPCNVDTDSANSVS